ncbi:MAG TPA: DUF4307 domain-containing protein [Actinotalea sp.]|jgi:hypothetical protein
MTASPAMQAPAGRYGRPASAQRRRRAVLGLWALGLAALSAAVWLGLRTGNEPVTWQDVGFTLDGSSQVEVVFDVIRPDPSVPVRCRLQALNHQYGEVGALDVDVAASTSTTVRLRSTLAISEAAVTGIVDRCWVP